MSDSEARLLRVIEHAPIVLWAVDEKGLVTLSEGKGLATLGLKPGEVVGRSVFEMYADVPGVLAHMERCLGGEEFTGIVEVGPHWFETHYTPIRDASQRVVGLLAVSLDVTERQKGEAERGYKEEVAVLHHGAGRRLTAALDLRFHDLLIPSMFGRVAKYRLRPRSWPASCMNSDRKTHPWNA